MVDFEQIFAVPVDFGYMGTKTREGDVLNAMKLGVQSRTRRGQWNSRQATAPRWVKRHVKTAESGNRCMEKAFNRIEVGPRGGDPASRDGNISRKEAWDLNQCVRLRTSIPPEEE